MFSRGDVRQRTDRALSSRGSRITCLHSAGWRRDRHGRAAHRWSTLWCEGPVQVFYPSRFRLQAQSSPENLMSSCGGSTPACEAERRHSWTLAQRNTISQCVKNARTSHVHTCVQHAWLMRSYAKAGKFRLDALRHVSRILSQHTLPGKALAHLEVLDPAEAQRLELLTSLLSPTSNRASKMQTDAWLHAPARG